MDISAAQLAQLPAADLEQILTTLEKIEQDRASGRVGWLCDKDDCDGTAHRGRPGAHARPNQRPPSLDDDWDVWALFAGRGFGKTRCGAEWVWRMAKDQERGALVGPTAADTRDIMVEGESGILACAPATFRPVYEPSKRKLTYPNGAIQMLYSADEPDRLRGPQHHYGWLDELAAWRRLQYAWDMLQMGMRLGDHPRICVTTTPRPLPVIKAIVKDPMSVLVKGSTYDNLANLAPTFRRAVVAKYEGTTLGRQELDAEILDDMPGALVARAVIERNRVDVAPELDFVVVGMDPAGTGQGDETGLVAVGRAAGTDYVLHDVSKKMTPRQAASAAWALVENTGASVLVVEDNGGKDWIGQVLTDGWYEHKGADPRDAVQRADAGPPPMKRINASQGKKLRAQPVAMRYEQNRVKHVGVFPELEDQLTTWIPEEDPDSPDHIDAMVHAVAYMMKWRDRSAGRIASPHLVQTSARVHPLDAARQARQQAS